ncbi:TPA: hypothetical protein MND73_004649 [Salmonella enterica subsp. houtenae]|nr:hypothetical protein [Salmonella enterica subsp. houtenae]
MLKYTLFFLFIIFSVQSNALGIDKMILISGIEQDGDYFNLNNDSNQPVFVKSEISEINYIDGKPSEIIYSKENLATWKITLNPSLFILEPGESRKIGVEQINSFRKIERDEIYAISFLPQVQGISKSKGSNKMSLQIGFKSYLFIPASRSVVKYAINFDKKSGKLSINNKGNTLIIAEINKCQTLDKIKGKECSASFLVPAGRLKHFNVPELLRTGVAKFQISNFNKTFTKDEVF